MWEQPSSISLRLDLEAAIRVVLARSQFQEITRHQGGMAAVLVSAPEIQLLLERQTFEGIEVAGYHLHFVDSARRRGGHVLGSRSGGPLRARIDPSDDLHVELPPAVDLTDPDLAAATHAAIDAAERG